MNYFMKNKIFRKLNPKFDECSSYLNGLRVFKINVVVSIIGNEQKKGATLPIFRGQSVLQLRGLWCQASVSSHR